MSAAAPAAPRPSDASLWWPLAAPPLAWLVNLEASYALVPWACRHDVPRAPLVVSIATVVVCLAAVAASALRLPAVAAEEEDRPLGRKRLMVLAGLALGLLFALVSLTTVIPQLVLDPCAGAS